MIRPPPISSRTAPLFPYTPIFRSGAGNGNPLTQQKKLALSDLKDARWLAYPHRAPLNILLKQELERADINTFTAPVETASTFVTITLLSGSADFVALIP